jgi:hypothetical protein
MPSERYRITMNGFSVVSQSWDHALNVDGWGDEVYLRWTTVVADRNGNARFGHPPTDISTVMGDADLAGRVVAGTGTDNGGLVSGNSFPTVKPWQQARPPSVEFNYPPQTAWEGELEQGENAVVFTPSIWEWDGGGNAIQGWIEWADQLVDKFGERIANFLGPTGKAIFEVADFGLDAAVTGFGPRGVFGIAGDRPIGMVADGAENFKFVPLSVVLNYETAEEFVNTNHTGKGNGVYAFNFDDDEYLRANYVLYIQVERVQDINDWQRIGHANYVTGMAGVNGHIF